VATGDGLRASPACLLRRALPGSLSKASDTGMSARAIFHLFLHAAVPALLAWMFWRKRFMSAWVLMLLGWIIDLDHLLADPIYAPNRCSIGFHPLHTAPASAVYAGLCVPKKTRLFGIGLMIHIVLDAIDCWWMRA